MITSIDHGEAERAPMHLSCMISTGPAFRRPFGYAQDRRGSTCPGPCTCRSRTGAAKYRAASACDLLNLVRREQCHCHNPLGGEFVWNTRLLP